MSSYDKKSRKTDNIDRGNKGINYLGTAAFVCSRLVDPYAQYAILKYGWGSSLIGLLRGKMLPPSLPPNTDTALDRLGLSPYRTTLWAMSIGSVLKHNYHATLIMQERISTASGFMAGTFHGLGNTLNSLLFVCAQTSPSMNGEHFPQTPLVLGLALYVLGLVLEWLSEQQRHNFKKNPANNGKVYTGGLFSLSRHINYLGYTLWRTGYALAAGGWIWAGAMFVMGTSEFTRNIIPIHQRYMEEKYGEQFERYKKATSYKFIPWVY